MDENQSKLEPDLIAAYKNTLFQAHLGDEVITFKVGQKLTPIWLVHCIQTKMGRLPLIT